MQTIAACRSFLMVFCLSWVNGIGLFPQNWIVFDNSINLSNQLIRLCPAKPRHVAIECPDKHLPNRQHFLVFFKQQDGHVPV